MNKLWFDMAATAYCWALLNSTYNGVNELHSEFQNSVHTKRIRNLKNGMGYKVPGLIRCQARSNSELTTETTNSFILPAEFVPRCHHPTPRRFMHRKTRTYAYTLRLRLEPAFPAPERSMTTPVSILSGLCDWREATYVTGDKISVAISAPFLR